MSLIALLSHMSCCARATALKDVRASLSLSHSPLELFALVNTDKSDSLRVTAPRRRLPHLPHAVAVAPCIPWIRTLMTSRTNSGSTLKHYGRRGLSGSFLLFTISSTHFFMTHCNTSPGAGDCSESWDLTWWAVDRREVEDESAGWSPVSRCASAT